MKPLSPEMMSLLAEKHMPKESPILVRIFKEEAELEVWKQDDSGRFALLKTYPICRWSGELGPKIKQGDRQAPEGFYTITPGQMNPNSNYYLSFNLGFPNAYDRANDRTGSFLMVHGDCSSAGCYAMTDEQIGEIYALGRESFFGGQKSFQVQAYPFRMTALNMARHRNNPAMPFWRMIKEGYDHFEVSHLEPKVDVCEKRYVFDAVPRGGANTPLNFSPRGPCPPYEVRPDIAAAVAQKQQRDEREFAELVASGTQTVAIHTGTDGGMNPVFMARLRSPDRFDDNGRIQPVLASLPALPPTVNPPRTPDVVATTGSVTVADVPLPRTAPRRRVGTTATATANVDEPSLTNKLMGLFSTASADSAPTARSVPSRSDSGNPIDRVSKWIGLGSSDESKSAPPAPKARPLHTATAPHADSPAASRPAPQPRTAAPQQTEPPAAPQTQQAQPQVAEAADEAVKPAANTAPAGNEPLMHGAQPMLPSASFDSRWSAFR